MEGKFLKNTDNEKKTFLIIMKCNRSKKKNVYTDARKPDKNQLTLDKIFFKSRNYWIFS